MRDTEYAISGPCFAMIIPDSLSSIICDHRMESLVQCIQACYPVTIDHLRRTPPELRMECLSVTLRSMCDGIAHRERPVLRLHARLLLVPEAVYEVRLLPV